MCIGSLVSCARGVVHPFFMFSHDSACQVPIVSCCFKVASQVLTVVCASLSDGLNTLCFASANLFFLDAASCALFYSGSCTIP